MPAKKKVELSGVITTVNEFLTESPPPSEQVTEPVRIARAGIPPDGDVYVRKSAVVNRKPVVGIVAPKETEPSGVTCKTLLYVGLPDSDVHDGFVLSAKDSVYQDGGFGVGSHGDVVLAASKSLH